MKHLFLILAFIALNAEGKDLDDVTFFAAGESVRFDNQDRNWGHDQTGFRNMGYYNVNTEHSNGYSLGLRLSRPRYSIELRATDYGGPGSSSSYPVDENSPAGEKCWVNHEPINCPTQHAVHWGNAKSVGIEVAPKLKFLGQGEASLGVGVHGWMADFNYCISDNGNMRGFQDCQKWDDYGATLVFRPRISYGPLFVSAAWFPTLGPVRGGENNDKGMWNDVYTISGGVNTPINFLK